MSSALAQYSTMNRAATAAAAVPYRPSYLWIASSKGEAGETPDATSLIVDRIHKLLEVQQPEEALKICDRAMALSTPERKCIGGPE